ncbi:hypothetical protein [Fusobacterium russii]|uniref:hypothetical protein n=1 Tax=Fusobacterium russii TaxID=854 RepID=UPI0003B42B7C|nr:hypothetical protein [Fusobacterium russii]
MFNFRKYQLLLKNKFASLMSYILSIFIPYFIVTIKENKKNIVKIERFFIEDVLMIFVVSIFISYNYQEIKG